MRQWLTGAPQGRIYDYDPQIDSLRTSLTKSLTFKKLESVLANARDGDITTALLLFQEMESRDDRVYSVSGTRRRSLTGLKYEVVSAADVQQSRVDKKLADEAADFVRERIDELSGFQRMLKHLATAIGSNLAVVELVWEYGELIELVPIPPWRLTMKPQESFGIRVITEDERTYGVPARFAKFMVHTPIPSTGAPLPESIHFAGSVLWLMKKLALSDWATYIELFGMPVRIGRYDNGTLDEDKVALKNMLQNMGTRAWAMISRSVEIEFKETAQRGTAPFMAFMAALDRAIGILWLGGNLTSDTTGGTGTFAAAAVQDEVKDDLRDDDVESEAETVREQLLGPLVELKFAGRDAPVPYFRRIKPETIDRIKEADLLIKGQQAGLSVPKKWAHERLGIKEPDADDEVLVPSLDAFGEGLAEDVSGIV